nr:ATP-binding protein [Agromyces seonyuensis]
MRITREGADRLVWEESLRRVLRDDSLEVYWWTDEDGRYERASGDVLPRDAGAAGADRSYLTVAAPGGRPLAVIRHDRVLTDNARLLDGVSSALRLSVDNGRLRSEVERTLAQVRESRLRIVEAAARAQRSVERDLHDGAQQRLVSLGLELRLIANAAASAGSAGLAEDLEIAIEELGQALRELRELAHGIHPSLLSQGGLSLAVPELAGRCPVPVDVEVQADGRLPELVESTAYFVVAEALANIAKHAQASRVWVRAWAAGGMLHLVVRDDGVGGVDPNGSGVMGMRDRVEAADGSLVLESERAHGTTIRAEIPLPPGTAV